MPCMDKYPAGRKYHSETHAFDAGENGVNVELDFLKPALDKMGKRGMIRRFALRLRLTVTTDGAGAAREELFARALSRFILKDAGGPRVDVSGASLRVANYVEVPQFQLARNLGNGAAETVECWMGLPVEPCRAERPQDYRMNLEQLVEGGECSIDWASSATIGPAALNQIVVVSGSLQMWVECIDEGDESLKKTHWVLRDIPIDASDKVFNLGAGQYKNPRVRWAQQYIGEVGESLAAGPGAWATQSITSRSLDYTSIPHTELVDTYKTRINPRQTASELAADETDPVLRGSAIPIWMPFCEQPQSEMPPTGSLDWETTDTFDAGTFIPGNKPRMIVLYTVDRPDKCETEGPRSVKLGNGLEVPVERFPAGSDLPKKLPTVAQK